MVRHLASSSSDAEPIEIVGDSTPKTLCTRRDERYACCPNSLPLLGDTLRLVCSGATAPPRGGEFLVEHLHPLRLAKWDRFELFCLARARLKSCSTGGKGIAPSNALSFGAKALSTTIEVGSESEVVVPPVFLLVVKVCSTSHPFPPRLARAFLPACWRLAACGRGCVALAAWMGILMALPRRRHPHLAWSSACREGLPLVALVTSN